MLVLLRTCSVIGCVVQGMKTSGTPHVTWHHCAEDQNPLFFLVVYLFIYNPKMPAMCIDLLQVIFQFETVCCVTHLPYV